MIRKTLAAAAIAAVLATPAHAHGGFFFGLNIGVPLFAPAPYYVPYVSPYPAYIVPPIYDSTPPPYAAAFGPPPPLPLPVRPSDGRSMRSTFSVLDRSTRMASSAPPPPTRLRFSNARIAYGSTAFPAPPL